MDISNIIYKPLEKIYEHKKVAASAVGVVVAGVLVALSLIAPGLLSGALSQAGHGLDMSIYKNITLGELGLGLGLGAAGGLGVRNVRKRNQKNEEQRVKLNRHQFAEGSLNQREYYENLTLNLFKAVKEKDVKGLEELLSDPSAIHMRDEKGETLLHIAVEKGYVEVVEMLLERKIDINGKGFKDATPLHIAAEIGDVTMINLLLKNGAKLDAVDKKGNTPLHLAILYLDKEGLQYSSISLLITRGAPRDLKNKEGLSPQDLLDRLENN